MPRSIDWSVVEEWECTTDYFYLIADDSDSKSGPTAGTGFDIGQINETQFNTLFGKDTDVGKKLKPLVGKKGQDARDLFKGPKGESPKKKAIKCGDRSAWIYLPYNDADKVSLDAATLAKVQKSVQDDKLTNIVAAFDKSAGGKNKTKFDDLPGDIQTAIVSFQWQWGEFIGSLGAADRRRKLFEAFTDNDWDAAQKLLADEFKKSSDPTPDRRDEEIELIKSGAAELAKAAAPTAPATTSTATATPTAAPAAAP